MDKNNGTPFEDNDTISVSVRPLACGVFKAYSKIGNSEPKPTASEAMKSWVQKYVSDETILG